MDSYERKRLNSQIAEIQHKIQVELRMRDGALAIKSQLQQWPHIEQASRSIQESDKRIAFLHGELERAELLLQSITENSMDSLSMPDKGSQSKSESESLDTSTLASSNEAAATGTEETPKAHEAAPSSINNQDKVHQTPPSPFAFWKRDYGLSWDKINFKVNEVSYKLHIEQELLAGAERLVEACADPTRNTEELKKSKYSAERSVQDGRNKIMILKEALKRYSSLAIEQPLPWDVSVEPDVGVLGTLDERELISGTLKIRIPYVSDIGDGESPFYVECRTDCTSRFRWKLKPRDSPMNNEEAEIKLSKATMLEILIGKKDGGNLLGIAFFRLGWLFPPNLTDPVQMDEFIEFEPVGSFRMQLSFVPNVDASKTKLTLLDRQPAIKRKQFFVLGHHLIFKKFYDVLKCAHCLDFFYVLTGYQCQNCKFVCHKKCQSKLYNTCCAVGKSEQPLVDDAMSKLKFNIPHRFEPCPNAVLNFCMHCGFRVPAGRDGLKCEECNLVCHGTCHKYIPNHCGLNPKLAYSILHPELVEGPIGKKRSEMQTKANSIKDASSASSAEEGSTVMNYLRQHLAFISPLSLSLSKSPSDSIDRYEFISVIGKGNFGKVILSKEKETGKLFAIKILRKDSIMDNDEAEGVRTERKVFIMATKEKHPFLVQMTSCFQDDSHIFFVMEYVSGGDLMFHIQQRRFSEADARLYAAEVLLGLEYLHKNGIIYRDLKLDNLLLTTAGHVKIADYGLCKEGITSCNTTTTTFCGTPEFMAPEIVLDKPYTRSVDWWAFGVMLYELLLGQAPFFGNNESEIFDAILTGTIVYPSRLHSDAKDLISKLLMRDPLLRLGSSKSDAEAIKQHHFFQSIDFDALLKEKITPTFRPSLSSPTDLANFDEEFTQEPARLTPVPSRNATSPINFDFKDFSL